MVAILKIYFILSFKDLPCWVLLDNIIDVSLAGSNNKCKHYI